MWWNFRGFWEAMGSPKWGFLVGTWALNMLELSKKNRMHWTLGFKVNSDFTVKEQNLLGLKHNLNGQLAIKRLGNEHHFHVQFAVPGIWRRFSGCLVDFKLASMFVLLGPWEWIKIHEICGWPRQYIKIYHYPSQHWLVVWNIFYFSIILGRMNHPNCYSLHFSEG